MQMFLQCILVVISFDGVMQVERCKYCVAQGETLLTKMRLFTPDMNWLRLWAFNGADDGIRPLTTPPGIPCTCPLVASCGIKHRTIWGTLLSRAFNDARVDLLGFLRGCASATVMPVQGMTLLCPTGDDRTLTLDDPDLLTSVGHHRVINVGILYRPRTGEDIQVEGCRVGSLHYFAPIQSDSECVEPGRGRKNANHRQEPLKPQPGRRGTLCDG